MGGRRALRPSQPRVPIASLTTADERHLAHTLELARQAAGRVEPDPLVGALVVDPQTGEAVGQGWHAELGGPHAEPLALAVAGARARRATLYCNLEPCGYEAPGKRQPACTKAIISAGIGRVVIGMIDPHPRVRGRGIERLREAGIVVAVAADPRPGWELNADYTTRMVLGRAFEPSVDLDDGRPSEAWLAAVAGAS